MNITNQRLSIVYKDLEQLTYNPKNSRTHSEKQIHKIAKSINKLGFNNPILIDKKDMIIAGHGRVEAAKLLGIESVPTICLENLTEEEIRIYIIADNKLAEEAGWDKDMLKIEFECLSDLGFDISLTGFSTPEIDLIINYDAIESNKSKKFDPIELLPAENDIEKKVKNGELWQLGEHQLFCGNALQPESYELLMRNEFADVVFTDPPYNVKIKGNVTTKNHDEFAQGAGEMTQDEFVRFLKTAMQLHVRFSTNGSIHFQCMDWRHIQEMLLASKDVYSELKNLCVWDKGTGGMGSLYRSQHELVFVFKNGDKQHVNNVELGVHGRYRTNVWAYRGMHASNPQAKELLKLHPTVKPVGMIIDALLDVSKLGDIVLDSFAGSGSTLLAAERTKRKARVIEIDPKYADITIYRWEKLTGKKATKIYSTKEKKQ